MLIYDPALDPYHSAIRILTILEKHLEGLDIELVRVLDFYLAYPSKIFEITLPMEFKFVKSYAKDLITPYRRAPIGKSQFERMKPIFTAALHGLVAADYLDKENLNNGKLILNQQKIPSEILQAIKNYSSRDGQIKDFIIESLPRIKFYGPNGLKHRTGLLGYKYDTI